MLINILLAFGILAATGALLGAALGFASKAFFVKEDERIAQITECLPGANCGGCGFAGCANYADAIVNSGEPINRCQSCSQENLDKISQIVGVEAQAGEKKVAFVRCNGQNTLAGNKYEYYGISDCAAAARLMNGFMECSYGCIGFGNCAAVCPVSAISVTNGVASVDAAVCIGCGKCMGVCPKHVITLLPENARVLIRCSSEDKGAITRKNCDSGCLGCKICEKTCSNNAVHVTNNVAAIDYSLCTGCGECAKACPKKIITVNN